MDLKIANGAYEIGQASAQECVNWYPEIMEGGGRSQAILRQVPPISTWATVGNGPIRGLYRIGAFIYAVSGKRVYKLDAQGNQTLHLTGPDIPGTDPISWRHNSNNEICIVNGSTTGFQIVNDIVAAIADADMPGGDVVTVLDDFFIVNAPGTDNFYISAIGDVTTWGTLDFASKEGNPRPLISLIANHRDLFLFGEETYEIWRNTGNADFPFERQEGTFQERGCVAPRSVANIDNTIYFLGDDRVVYRIDGYRPVRVSNHGIEAALQGATFNEVVRATAFTHTLNGHYFYVLNVAGKTWVYDVTFSMMAQQNTWHERRSAGLTRWVGNNYVEIRGRKLIGSFDNNEIYDLDTANTNESSAAVDPRIRATAPIFSGIRPVSISRVELRCNVGLGNTAVADPQIALEVSKDGGRTWGKKKFRSLGKIGEDEKKIIWRRLGRAREWVLRWTVTDDVIVDLYEAYIDEAVGSG